MEQSATSATTSTVPAGQRPDWVTLAARGGSGRRDIAPVRTRSVAAQVLLGAMTVLAVVAVLASFAARQVAEQESITDAASTGDLLAREVAEPALTQALADGDPAAVARFDAVIRDRVLPAGIVRVKVWSADGRVVYSDEAQLVGQRFELDDAERDVLSAPRVEAEISDVSHRENQFEANAGKLLEVYRPIWTPDGQILLFEVYLPYDRVTARAGEMWRDLMIVTAVTLLAFALLMVPVLWRLLRRLRAAQAQREALLQHAVEASDDERRRIAATLHDGVVQELVATSFTVAGAAEQARALEQPELAGQLRQASTAVRASIRGLRSLLVDIYPPSLAGAGLPAAVEDLAEVLRARGVDVTVAVDGVAAQRLTPDQQQLAYRVAQECLRNASRHSAASRVMVTLTDDAGEGVVRLQVVDDGRGFDPTRLDALPGEGHFGVHILSDLAAAAGAGLAVATAPGQGCRWRLDIPTS